MEEKQFSLEHIRWAYRILLDREPENEDVIRQKKSYLNNTQELRCEILMSSEFHDNNPEFTTVSLFDSDIPIPPAELMELVTGNKDSHYFLYGGGGGFKEHVLRS